MKYALLILVFVSVNLLAQDLKKAANEYFAKQEYEKAAESLAKLVKTSEADSSDWYNLAYSQMKIRAYDKAIENFEEAKKRNMSSSIVDLNIAKIYTYKNDEAGLLSFLEKSANSGLFTYSALKTSPEFDKYQMNESFKKILNKVELNAYPCLSDDNSRHFDFWLGEWDVFVGENKVGENSITKAVGGCAIHENYTTARNYAGQSINFYDPIDKKWHQHWVGSSGDIYNYIETEREPGFLQFISKFYNPNGQISLSRLTFTHNEDGTVSQLFENSTDDGETWTPAFNGLYKKKK